MNDKVRPRILVINPTVPYPPNQGSKVAALGLIRALQKDFDVTVLARLLSHEDDGHARELEAFCERVVTVMAPNVKSLFHRVFYKVYYYLLTVFLRRSFRGLYDCPGVFQRAARELAREDFDLVIMVYWPLHRLLPLFPPEKSVLVTFDIDFLINRKISLLERRLLTKIQAVRRWFAEQREELQAYRTAKHIWTLTRRDKLSVESVSRDNARVEVLPFGMDLDYLAASGMRRNPGEVLFWGYLKAHFNRDALEYFVARIYPHLDGVSDLSITVLGGHLPKELEFFGLNPEVEVVGLAPDVRPYLHRASCLVVPLRFGGGLRIRIIEAMAAGLPVICSEVAIAGMPFEAETHYLEANRPEEYALQIGRLNTEDGLSRRISEAAGRQVSECYSRQAQEAGVVRLVRGVLSEA